MDNNRSQNNGQSKLHSALHVIRRAGIVLIILFIAYSMLDVALRVYKPWYANAHPTLTEIERLTSLKFPEGAKLLESDFSTGFLQQERLLEADIEINIADIEMFTSHPGADIAEDDQPTSSDSSQRSGINKSVVFSIKPNKNVRSIIMAIDQVSKKRAVMHMEWIGQNTLAQ